MRTERRFEFIPIRGFLIFSLYAMRRLDCRRCEAVVVEEVPWGDGKLLSVIGKRSFLSFLPHRAGGDIIRAEGAIIRPSQLRSGHGDEVHSEITLRVSEPAQCSRLRPRWRLCSAGGLSGLGFVINRCCGS
jgi:hypothetical protein